MKNSLVDTFSSPYIVVLVDKKRRVNGLPLYWQPLPGAWNSSTWTLGHIKQVKTKPKWNELQALHTNTKSQKCFLKHLLQVNSPWQKLNQYFPVVEIPKVVELHNDSL